MCEIMVEVLKFRVLTSGQRSLFDVHAKINEGSDMVAVKWNFRYLFALVLGFVSMR
jgi:hypothetical protein